MEIVLDNGMRVYRDASAVRQISDIVVGYLLIWESQDFVQILLKRWIKISLKPSWKSKVLFIKSRVYPLDNNARCLVDNTFDEMHKQGHLQFTTDLTLFSFPVFIIWKTDVQGKKKSRAVVDICKLNEWVLSDSYFLLLQSEIIANI